KVRAMVVPGSQTVKHAAEREGLHKVFQEAGFEWRESGCSMCLGMNPDILQPGERCASTSNRNFEGRQGRGGRKPLVCPMMAGAARMAANRIRLLCLISPGTKVRASSWQEETLAADLRASTPCGPWRILVFAL